MKKKRSRRKSKRPPSAPGPLQYKVVELSTVDEATLETTLNQWVRRGWSVDGIQFAMRESSRRPAMAFVLFTRPGESEAPEADRARVERRPGEVSAYERLVQLAEEGDE